MLEVRGLSVSYGQHRALENASLKVGKGEIVVILGANGAGKTTLLNAICGISEGRVSGSVAMDGADLAGLSPDKVVEEGVALVPEGRGIFGDLTVQENLTLGAYPMRARDEAEANLDRVLTLFPKLGERRRQVARTMSGGEQQMVAIGRAMMSNPAILILDEPSLGLSPLLCKDLFQSLKTVRATGLGILLVEQNAKQSLRVADRGYLLENGEIVHEDDAHTLANDPAVQKAYLGGSGAAPRATGPVPAAAARPGSTGPSPSEIAAAAIRKIAPQPKPAAPQATAAQQAPGSRNSPAAPRAPAAPTASAPKPGVPDTDALVARAASMSSRKPVVGRPNGAMPPASPIGALRPERPVMPDLSSSTDRLRAALREIEDAARRAETYQSPKPRR